MAPTPCSRCQTGRAVVKRPKNLQKLCKPCFLDVFEQEVHHTITSARLFRPGDRVAIGASGGKDSTVLASVLKTLNHRHGYGLELVLLSIDEGIKGYRDDSLETVKRNSAQYGMPLHVVGYDQLYGWTMDQVVETIGRKGNCTYCGVFRRQALDRGVRMLGISHLVTGHNADDMAETILMNLLRGDLPRLARGTSIVTGGGASGGGTGDVRRSKPLKYAYEKEIVLYAHHKKLDYFSTECVYSPEAFRGTARALIKSLERVRPSVILDIVRSGEDLARLVGGGSGEGRSCGGDGESGGGCASVDAKSQADEMGQLEMALKGADSGLETEITLSRVAAVAAVEMGGESIDGEERVGEEMDVEERGGESMGGEQKDGVGREAVRSGRASERERRRAGTGAGKKTGGHSGPMQTLGSCQTCGYMSSQAICQACRLLETLNSNRAQVQL